MRRRLDIDWRCDFCPHTDDEAENIKIHQKTCEWNPKFKTCWSCKFHTTGYRCTYCKKNIRQWDFVPDTNPGDYGNCTVWKFSERYDENVLRKLKLEKINESRR